MTDREILSNAIDKAIANGFKFEKDMVPPVLLMEYEEKMWNYIPYRNQLNGFLFSHSFAKAFWGTDKTDWENINKKDNWWEWQDSNYWVGNEAEFVGERWQYHLQNMVLEDNPIEYLEKFL